MGGGSIQLFDSYCELGFWIADAELEIETGRAANPVRGRVDAVHESKTGEITIAGSIWKKYNSFMIRPTQ
jgi:hypothetical protein